MLNFLSAIFTLLFFYLRNIVLKKLSKSLDSFFTLLNYTQISQILLINPLTIIRIQNQLLFNLRFQMNAAAPQLINVRKHFLQVFHIELDAFVPMLQIQLTITHIVAVINRDVWKAAVHSHADQLIAHMRPVFINNLIILALLLE